MVVLIVPYLVSRDRTLFRHIGIGEGIDLGIFLILVDIGHRVIFYGRFFDIVIELAAVRGLSGTLAPFCLPVILCGNGLGRSKVIIDRCNAIERLGSFQRVGNRFRTLAIEVIFIVPVLLCLKVAERYGINTDFVENDTFAVRFFRVRACCRPFGMYHALLVGIFYLVQLVIVNIVVGRTTADSSDVGILIILDLCAGYERQIGLIFLNRIDTDPGFSDFVAVFQTVLIIERQRVKAVMNLLLRHRPLIDWLIGLGHFHTGKGFCFIAFCRCPEGNRTEYHIPQIDFLPVGIAGFAPQYQCVILTELRSIVVVIPVFMQFMLGFMELVGQSLIQLIGIGGLIQHKGLIGFIKPVGFILVVVAFPYIIMVVGIFLEVVGIGLPDINARLAVVYHIALFVHVYQCTGGQRKGNRTACEPCRKRRSNAFCRSRHLVTGNGFGKLIDQFLICFALIAAIKSEIDIIRTQMIEFRRLVP